MMSTPNVTTELRDLLYNQFIDNTCCYLFFIYPTDWIRVYKIRLVGTGENRGKPCPVCKKSLSAIVKNAENRVCYARNVAIHGLKPNS